MTLARSPSEPHEVNATVSHAPRAVPPLAASLLAVALLASCSANRPPDVLDEIPMSTRHARMMVRNQHRHAVQVQLIPYADAYDVGLVSPTSSKAFRLPQHMNGVPARVQILCLVANDLHTTHEIEWGGAEVIELQIQPMLNLSTVAIRR